MTITQGAETSDSWHRWYGGSCPLDGVPVEVAYRDGQTSVGHPRMAQDLIWHHAKDSRTGYLDIVAFRTAHPNAPGGDA